MIAYILGGENGATNRIKLVHTAAAAVKGE